MIRLTDLINEGNNNLNGKYFVVTKPFSTNFSPDNWKSSSDVGKMMVPAGFQLHNYPGGVFVINSKGEGWKISNRTADGGASFGGGAAGTSKFDTSKLRQITSGEVIKMTKQMKKKLR